MSASSTHWMRRALRVLALAFLLAVVLGSTYEEVGRWQDSQHLFRIGRAVDIGGRSLDIDCAGSGSPAVILESGGGGYGGYGWRMVQAEVAKFTTVCWYDRAGEGWSDPMPTARSSATISSRFTGTAAARPGCRSLRAGWSLDRGRVRPHIYIKVPLRSGRGGARRF